MQEKREKNNIPSNCGAICQKVFFLSKKMCIFASIQILYLIKKNKFYNK